MQQLMTIGEFAQQCGLSRSALRFYDQNGLVRPQAVDAETGYRYYAPEQADEAQLIKRLRAAELPMPAVRDYLCADEEGRRAILELHRKSVRDRARVVEAELDRLQSDLAAGSGDRGWVLAPDHCAAALRQVLFALPQPGDRPDLDGVWLEAAEGSLKLVATDSYRLAVRDLVPDAAGTRTLRGMIGREDLDGLLDRLSTATSLILTDSAGGAILTHIDGEPQEIGADTDGFPDYAQILEGVADADRVTVARVSFLQALAGIEPDREAIELRFGPEGVTLGSPAPTAHLPGEWTGPPLRVVLAARFMVDAVGATVGPDIVIEARGPLSPIALRSADSGAFSVLTMPIRPDSGA